MSNTEHKTHFISGANSYMFRQKDAIIRYMYRHLIQGVSCKLFNCILINANLVFLKKKVERKKMRDMNDKNPTNFVSGRPKCYLSNKP